MSNLQSLRYRLRGSIAHWFEIPAAKVLARLKLTPSAVTLAGLALAMAAAWLIVIGWFWQAAVVAAISALFDLLDGGLARYTGKTSKRGALLDSSADRVQEGVILGGFALYFATSNTQWQSWWGVLVVLAAFGGSMMVSYVRARAEGLGVKGTAGFFTRPERVAVTIATLVAGAFFAPLLFWGVVVLAIGSWTSAIWRFVGAWREL